MGFVESRPVISHTYIWLTMANYEYLKLAGALGNAAQKIHTPLPNFPGFDKDSPLTTALKTPPTTHLSTPSSHSPPLLPFSQTPTPTLTFTSISSSSITIFEPYIPQKNEITRQLSTLVSSSSITQTVPSSSHARPPIHYH